MRTELLASEAESVDPKRVAILGFALGLRILQQIVERKLNVFNTAASSRFNSATTAATLPRATAHTPNTQSDPTWCAGEGGGDGAAGGGRGEKGSHLPELTVLCGGNHRPWQYTRTGHRNIGEQFAEMSALTSTVAVTQTIHRSRSRKLF